VVGKVVPITVNPVQVNALVVQSSLNLIIIFFQSVGAPVKENVVAAAIAVNWYTSVTATSITAVASEAVVTTLAVSSLLVRAFVELILGITTPSTASTPAALLDKVVSLACHSSTDQQDTALLVPMLIVQNPLAIDPEARAPVVTRLTQVVIAAWVAWVVAVSGASQVIVVTVAAFPVILATIALVTVRSTNHHLVILVPVLPISPVS